jgi:acetyl-CoA carboxylase biotin carboxyl carrier protein
MSTKRKLDEDLIRQLANLLTENDLTEIEIEQDELRIRVVRSRGPEAYVAPAVAAPTATPAAVPGAKPSPAEAANHPGTITSPMVGTAYRAPDENAAPFVKIGDQVTEGQTVLIIEAMKVMNYIPAPRSGRVTRILVEDAQPVEYGEPLMVIE